MIRRWLSRLFRPEPMDRLERLEQKDARVRSQATVAIHRWESMAEGFRKADAATSKRHK